MIMNILANPSWLSGRIWCVVWYRKLRFFFPRSFHVLIKFLKFLPHICVTKKASKRNCVLTGISSVLFASLKMTICSLIKYFLKCCMLFFPRDVSAHIILIYVSLCNCQWKKVGSPKLKKDLCITSLNSFSFCNLSNS